MNLFSFFSVFTSVHLTQQHLVYVSSNFLNYCFFVYRFKYYYLRRHQFKVLGRDQKADLIGCKQILTCQWSGACDHLCIYLDKFKIFQYVFFMCLPVFIRLSLSQSTTAVWQQCVCMTIAWYAPPLKMGAVGRHSSTSATCMNITAISVPVRI